MKSTRQVQREAQVLDVLLRQRGHADGDAGQVDALVVADRPADDDLGVHVGAVDLGDPQPDLAVVDQDRVARADVAGQPVVRRAEQIVVVAGDVAGGDRERLRPCSSLAGPSANVPSRIFGPCRSAKMPTPCPVVVGGLAHQPVDLARGRRGCRGSCSAGRRPCRRRRARGSAPGSRSRGRGCRRSLLYARLDPTALGRSNSVVP